MVNRTLVAGFAAVLAAGSMLAPVEASARGGGFGGGRGVGFHGGFNRHFVPVRPVPRHFVHGHLRPHFRSGRLHDRRDSGLDGANGLYGYGSSYPDYGSGYAPAYTGSADPAAGYPAYPYPGAGQPIGYRHVCRSTVEMVPSERGGTTDITVTRCYVVNDALMPPPVDK